MFTVRGQTKCFCGATVGSSHRLALLCEKKKSIKHQTNLLEMRTTMNTVDDSHTELTAAPKTQTQHCTNICLGGSELRKRNKLFSKIE